VASPCTRINGRSVALLPSGFSFLNSQKQKSLWISPTGRFLRLIKFLKLVRILSDLFKKGANPMSRIIQFRQQNKKNQPSCTHEMKTGGLLYTKHYLEEHPQEKIPEKFDDKPGGYYCFPKQELEITGCDGVFSIEENFAFYIECVRCGKKELYYTHDICFYCLHRLGEEIERKNLNDYFKNHPKSATHVSIKECLNCHRIFAWYRVDIEGEM